MATLVSTLTRKERNRKEIVVAANKGTEAAAIVLNFPAERLKNHSRTKKDHERNMYKCWECKRNNLVIITAITS
jgi:hypothetical protein